MEDNRKDPRFAARWRCAIVFEGNGKRETIQGRTNDVSISGVSVICHRNITPLHAITIHLLIDPGNGNHPPVIVEAQGNVKNNVLSGQQGGFRLSIQFTKFARDGKQVLQSQLPKDLVRSTKHIAATDVVPAKDVTTVADAAPVPDAAKIEDASPSADAVPVPDAAQVTST
ncbi:MAG: PilZ domain-containing protein [Sterolibacterium sp.]|nr:PilZ domain-containing protein [Sterolibacterium sp.]